MPTPLPPPAPPPLTVLAPHVDLVNAHLPAHLPPGLIFSCHGSYAPPFTPLCPLTYPYCTAMVFVQPLHLPLLPCMVLVHGCSTAAVFAWPLHLSLLPCAVHGGRGFVMHALPSHAPLHWGYICALPHLTLLIHWLPPFHVPAFACPPCPSVS